MLLLRMTLLDDLMNEIDHQKFSNYLPLIYRAEYDIKFGGCECVHPFDTKKWGRVASIIQKYFDSKLVPLKKREDPLFINISPVLFSIVFI